MGQTKDFSAIWLQSLENCSYGGYFPAFECPRSRERGPTSSEMNLKNGTPPVSHFGSKNYEKCVGCSIYGLETRSAFPFPGNWGDPPGKQSEGEQQWPEKRGFRLGSELKGQGHPRTLPEVIHLRGSQVLLRPNFFDIDGQGSHFGANLVTGLPLRSSGGKFELSTGSQFHGFETERPPVFGPAERMDPPRLVKVLRRLRRRHSAHLTQVSTKLYSHFVVHWNTRPFPEYFLCLWFITICFFRLFRIPSGPRLTQSFIS